jgi:hypothetical protein
MWPRVPCFERVISALFTVNVYTSTPTIHLRTGVRYTYKCAVTTIAQGPLDPLITAILDQQPGRAAKRLAPPGRLKRVLDIHSQWLFTANV